MDNIYLINAKGTDRYKVGISKDVKKRLINLQVSCPHDLLVVKTIKGERYGEKLLHRTFREFKIRGEWFKLNSELKKVIIKAMDLMSYVTKDAYPLGQHTYESIMNSLETGFITGDDIKTLEKNYKYYTKMEDEDQKLYWRDSCGDLVKISDMNTGWIINCIKLMNKWAKQQNNYTYPSCYDTMYHELNEVRGVDTDFELDSVYPSLEEES